MDATKVGVRQFRADLAEFIASDTPVAVTKHGQTVGYFIPAQAKSEADIEALKKAGCVFHHQRDRHFTVNVTGVSPST